MFSKKQRNRNIFNRRNFGKDHHPVSRLHWKITATLFWTSAAKIHLLSISGKCLSLETDHIAKPAISCILPDDISLTCTLCYVSVPLQVKHQAPAGALGVWRACFLKCAITTLQKLKSKWDQISWNKHIHADFLMIR